MQTFTPEPSPTPPTQTAMDHPSTTAPSCVKNMVTAINTKTAEEQSAGFSETKSTVKYHLHLRSKTPVGSQRTNELQAAFNKRPSFDDMDSEYKYEEYVQQSILKHQSSKGELLKQHTHIAGQVITTGDTELNIAFKKQQERTYTPYTHYVDT